ncbi:hypothetical protein HanPSC8_Chr17g0753931 [Helianthus annuus]|nr:hypothetical protein HanPSC8_Chr17g0753931 [Helianthus annuus]
MMEYISTLKEKVASAEENDVNDGGGVLTTLQLTRSIHLNLQHSSLV